MEAHKFYRILAVIIMLASIGTVMAILQYSYTVIFKGQIANVKIGLYWDEACSQPLNQSGFETWNLDLGDVDNPYNNTREVWIKNEGWYPVKITFEFHEYPPENVSIHAFAIWNESEVIPVGEVRNATIIIQTQVLAYPIPETLTYQVEMTVHAEQIE